MLCGLYLQKKGIFYCKNEDTKELHPCLGFFLCFSLSLSLSPSHASPDSDVAFWEEGRMDIGVCERVHFSLEKKVNRWSHYQHSHLGRHSRFLLVLLSCINGIKSKPHIHSYFLTAFPLEDFMNPGKYNITYMCSLKYDTN